MRAPAIALVVACVFLAALTRNARLTVERVNGPAGPVAVMWSRPGAEPAGLAIAAHGTNSHKEVFLPLAWELAARGWALAAVDSRTLSTEDGIGVRGRELAAVRDALAAWSPRAKLGYAGHSDGVSPALAAAQLAPGARPPVVALGATFGPHERAGTPLRAYVGAFDQVFPAPDVLACANQPPPVPVTLSWLSDHFLEQYDPLLVTGMASALVGPGKQEGAIERCTLRILVFALAIVSALLLGGRAGSREHPGAARTLVVVALLAWVAGSAAVWPAAVALAAVLGVACGATTVTRGGRVIVITGLLMFVNVVLATPHFWRTLPAGLPWLPIAVPWYVAAWIPKMAMFCVSVLQSTGPAGMLAPPGLLAIALAALAVPGGGDRAIARLASAASAGPSRASSRVAAALVALMLALWAVRLGQGMVQPDVLAAVALNFARSLILPGVYLVALATGRVKLT